jgi:HlyD family secretion protein
VPGRVWVVGPDGKPKALSLTLGLSDGTSTEILRGDLSEGQEVIIGLVGPPPARSTPPAQTGGPRLRL